MIFNKKKYIVGKKGIKEVDKETAKIIVREGLQALTEGERRDILSTCITGAGYTSTLSTYIDKNNYATYTKQVQTTNQMYNNRTDYGSEILRALIKSRVSFIGGEGMSVKADKKATRNFTEKFLKDNKLLDGSALPDNITTGEMEGKDLLELIPIKKDDKLEKIRVRNYYWYVTPYNIDWDDKTGEYKEAKVNASSAKKDLEGKYADLKAGKTNINLKKDKFVYVKLGGSPDRINLTPPLIANILTDIENFSRTKYDMRANNHLFGKAFPIFLVEKLAEAKALQNKINSENWIVGKGYAGTARDVKIIEPSGMGQEVLQKEMVDLMRIISLNTGIPVQHLAHPDLLSNRATAENMLEMINAATNQERLKWEEAFTELVQKAMIIATEGGMEGAVNDPDGFELKLNFATLALLEQIASVWLPLAEAEYVSRTSVRSRLPGINVSDEEKFLKKEKEERMENMPTVLQEGMQEQEIEENNQQQNNQINKKKVKNDNKSNMSSK